MGLLGRTTTEPPIAAELHRSAPLQVATGAERHGHWMASFPSASPQALPLGCEEEQHPKAWAQLQELQGALQQPAAFLDILSTQARPC